MHDLYIFSLLILSLAASSLFCTELPEQADRIRILVNPEISKQHAPYATHSLGSNADTFKISVASSSDNVEIVGRVEAQGSKPLSSWDSDLSADQPPYDWKVVKKENVEDTVKPSKMVWDSSQMGEQHENDQETIDRLDSFALASEVRPVALVQGSQAADVAPIIDQLVGGPIRRGPQSQSITPAPVPSRTQIGTNSRRAQTSGPVSSNNHFGMPSTRPDSDNINTQSDSGNSGSIQQQPVTSILDLLATLSTTTVSPPVSSDQQQTGNQNEDQNSSKKQEFEYQQPPRTKINVVRVVPPGSVRLPVSTNDNMQQLDVATDESKQPQQDQNRKPSFRPPSTTTSAQITSISEQQSSKSTIIELNQATARRPVTKSSTPCPPNGVSTVEHPTACDKYYFCSNGQATEQQCPNGLLYGTRDMVIDYCVHRWNTTCGEKTIPNPISSPGCRWQYGLFPVQGSPKCSIDYYECKAGVHEVKRCLTEGQMYDDRTKSCQWAEVLGCQSDSIADFHCPQDDQGNTYWPFPRYYLNQQDIIMCVHDKPQIVHCADHQRVDPEHLHCVPNETEQREAKAAKKAKKVQPASDKNKKVSV